MAVNNAAKNQLEPVTGSRATYYPFGDYRGLPPTQTLTDRGFTGQKSNNQPAADLGLLYYNARYYAPGLGRFISADTIVPDPTNPQAFNRYAYTLNNPTRFTDPSGHCIVQYSGDVQMNNPPYGTSGLCPNTATPVQEGHAAISSYHDSLGEPPNYPIYNTLANASTPCLVITHN